MQNHAISSPEARQEAQLALEAHSVELGIAKYREALAAGGDTAVPAGQQLIKAAMQPMEAALKKWLETTEQGLASRSAGVFHFVNQLDPVVTTWLTASTVISLLHERPTVMKVAQSICVALEGTLTMEGITKEQPALAAKMVKALEGMDSNTKKGVWIRKGGSLAGVKVIQWDTSVRLRVGTLLLHLFSESTGLVAEELVITGLKDRATFVRATESCRRWMEESHARCELLSPRRLPMVCPPRAWTNPFNGGYLTKALRQPLVKTRNRGYLTELKEWDMPWVYASVNALQETAWSVNVPVYETVKQLWEASSDLAALPPREPLPLPHKSWAEGEEPAPEVLHAWKVDAAKVYEANAQLDSKRQQVVQKLWVSEMMMERGNEFHYVYNLDWRGRMYPVGPALTPQGDDVAKALLCFTEGFHLGNDGAYWLAIHGANTFGVDKVSFEERIQWVQDNEEEILACARDPFVFRMWADADSPFCFLAFCFEWAKLQGWINGGNAQEDFESHLAVAFDGACNGLQNFSAMLRDPVGGAATGLVPGEKPSDIYTEVKNAAQAIIDRHAAEGNEQAQRWVGKLQRRHAKRNTMTVPYGVTKRGMRDQLFQELKEVPPQHRGADATYLAACNFEAIGEVVVAARQAMDWLREAAKVAASTGLPVRWTTPSGFLAVQDYRDDIGERYDFEVMGRRYRLTVNQTGTELNTRKQALGISPNFVHSLDASHLMRTVLLCAQDGITSFAMIHDSYGVHAGRATELRDNLRAAFVDQYAEPVLEQFRDMLASQLPDEMRDKLPPLPVMGSLDLEAVRQSEYFFA